MTLYEIIRTIEGVMRAQANCGTIIPNDVFRLNETAEAKYPAFAWTQGDHVMTGSDFIRYSFSLYYAERLTEDRSNEVTAQSDGVEALTNIVKSLRESHRLDVEGVTLTTFIQKFKDLTAGAYCRMSVLVPVTQSCEETF